MGEYKTGFASLEDKIRVGAEYVYQAMGVGHREQIYHNAFIFSLEEQDVLYEKERVVNFEYHGRSVGYGKADLVVWSNDEVEEEKIVVELKAVPEIGQKEKLQVIPYMRFLNIKKGIVINFPQATKSKSAKEEVEIHVETLE